MPIFMDRHDVSDDVTAYHVAQIHQEDLKIQGDFGCRGFTYWYDEDRKAAFCLIEAPDKSAIEAMHKSAHGDVPNQIIEVDPRIVEAFLGRIEDPDKVPESGVLLIDEPAYRILMVIETSSYIDRLESKQFTLFHQKFHNSAVKTINKFEGRVVNHDNNKYLVSFTSVTNAVLCGLKLHDKFKYITPNFDANLRRLSIGLSSGEPVANNEAIFGDAVIMATRLCEVVPYTIAMTSEVKTLYERENSNAFLDDRHIRVLNRKEEVFIRNLMDYMERIWDNPDFEISGFDRALGYSKSQVYRKMKQLTGRSPNAFLRDYRLKRAMEKLFHQKGSIKEVAFESGFNSPAYFTKCFYDRFGILPSKYIQQHHY